MSEAIVQAFRAATDPPVSGYLHLPARSNGDGIVLTHGAGSDCRTPLLVACAEAFSGAGFAVLRCDLPFRQSGKPPHFSATRAARDRDGLRDAVAELRKIVTGRVFLGGHSYGGRQSSMLSAEAPDLADGLLLLSYPLHPPRKPEQRRIQHLPSLRTPALFIHGMRDPFGSPKEVELAIKLIPARTSVLFVEGAGHDLVPKKKEAAQKEPVAGQVLKHFLEFFGTEQSPGAKS
jgi:predicted alpha/beta-hydrolase family hydrolase